MSNVIQFYMMKDSNMCVWTTNSIKLIEQFIFVKLDAINDNIQNILYSSFDFLERLQVI